MDEGDMDADQNLPVSNVSISTIFIFSRELLVTTLHHLTQA